jgi:hypothetical protein
LPDRTERNPEDGDPDLDGADEAHRVVHQRERATRRGATSLGVGLQPRPPCRHECVLGRDEDRVPEHEEEDGNETDGVAHGPVPGL